MTNPDYVASDEEASRIDDVRNPYVNRWWHYLSINSGLESARTVLDIAAGTGLLAKKLCEHHQLTFTLVEPNSHALARAQTNLGSEHEYINSTCEEVLLEKTYDAIFCTNAFHIYLEDKKLFLTKAYSALKPGGTLIFDISTWGIFDEKTEQYLRTRNEQIEKESSKKGFVASMPTWPDLETLFQYKELIEQARLKPTLEIFTTYRPCKDLDDSITKVIGRSRTWIPGANDQTRTEILSHATQQTHTAHGTPLLEYGRAFFICKKPENAD